MTPVRLCFENREILSFSYHHHHHYFERTRTPLTSSIHSFRFSMMFFSSAMLKPVSFCSWSTYVNAGLPLFLAPCFGSQSSRSLITSSFFLQQCPINRSLLIISVSVILGRLPYSSLLVLCSFHIQLLYLKNQPFCNNFWHSTIFHSR